MTRWLMNQPAKRTESFVEGPLFSSGDMEMGTMPESEQDTCLKYPDWQKPFQEAVLELDGDKLEKQIVTAQTAILSRLEAVQAERRALEDALGTLRTLQREEKKTKELGVEIRRNQGGPNDP